MLNISVHRQSESSKDANAQEVMKQQNCQGLCESCKLICDAVVRHGTHTAIHIPVFILCSLTKNSIFIIVTICCHLWHYNTCTVSTKERSV